MSPSEFHRMNDCYFSETGAELSPAERGRLEAIDNPCLATNQLIKAIESVKTNHPELNKDLDMHFSDLFRGIEDYVALVRYGNTLRKRDDFKIDDRCRQLDKSRKITHNFLLTQIKIVRTFLIECGYQARFLPDYVSLDNRETVTVWAKEVYLALAQLKEEFKKN